MDEKELLKEKFKSAISSAVKVISEKIDLDIRFGNNINPKKDKNNLYLSLLIEITWEVLENTHLIKLYRKYDKYSKNYIGDSIVNILADIFLMIFGFLFASNYKRAYLFVIISEIILYMKIEDNYEYLIGLPM